jgi:hypothetical protein
MLKRIVKSVVAAAALVVAAMLPGTPSPVQEAQAQSFECSGNFCTYGPFCVDAWGGCFYYSWWIGSGVNTVSEKAGLSNILKLCDPANSENNPFCAQLTSRVNLITEIEPSTGLVKPNVAVTCKVPGSGTCTGQGCGGSPNSGGRPFLIVANGTFTDQSKFNPQGCVKEPGTGAIKCTRSNSVPLENQPAAVNACKNNNWVVDKVWPVLFNGQSQITAPLSKRDPALWNSVLTTRCQLLDGPPGVGRAPGHPQYAPSADPSKNYMVCEAPAGGNRAQLENCPSVGGASTSCPLPPQ